ncbi:unnamed protein product [Oikopleura dioica]|uniref:Uncharacterized protein n=1 Tax=Oikopleura dioica TaxID=34765 RepID=E4XAT0_OIKDI|nr:unnamed protein product [Oikopleura dioica]
MSVPSRSRPGGDHDRSRNRQHPYNNQSSSKNDRTQSSDLTMHERTFEYCPDKQKKYKATAKIGQGTFWR